jgi:hypothetical protein
MDNDRCGRVIAEAARGMMIADLVHDRVTRTIRNWWNVKPATQSAFLVLSRGKIKRETLEIGEIEKICISSGPPLTSLSRSS